LMEFAALVRWLGTAVVNMKAGLMACWLVC
jgi:hypothetical protein